MSYDTMPVFVLKAKDNLAPRIIELYAAECVTRDLHEQARQVRKALAEFEDWRQRNPDKCKLPDHRHVPAGQPGSGSEGHVPRFPPKGRE